MSEHMFGYCRGLTIVGSAAVLMGVFSILPFAVMVLISIPQGRRAFEIACDGLRECKLEFVSKHFGTPLPGILFWASGVVLLSWLSFQEIVAAENLLYCIGMILEFIAFVRMRIKHPAASRPYKIHIGTVSSILMCVPPTILICFVVALSSLKVAAVSFVMLIIGFLTHPCLKHMDRKRWLKFSISSDLPDLHQATRDCEETLIR